MKKLSILFSFTLILCILFSNGLIAQNSKPIVITKPTPTDLTTGVIKNQLKIIDKLVMIDNYLESQLSVPFTGPVINANPNLKPVSIKRDFNKEKEIAQFFSNYKKIESAKNKEVDCFSEHLNEMEKRMDILFTKLVSTNFEKSKSVITEKVNIDMKMDGIVTFTACSANKEVPGIYQHVPKNADWIHKGSRNYGN